MVAQRGAVGLGVAFHRVVDQHEVGAAAGDGAAHPGGEVGAAARGGPVAGGTAGGGYFVVQAVGVLGRHGADAAGEMLGEVAGVGGRDDGVARVPRQPPGREDHAGIGRFGAAGGHQDHQAVDLAGAHGGELFEQKLVVAGGPQTLRTQRRRRPSGQGGRALAGHGRGPDSVRSARKA